MNVSQCDIEGLRVIEPKAFGDARGYLLEIWNQQRYQDAGLNLAFVQDNVSVSRKGSLRGLHCQNPNAQGKLVSVLLGEVYDVAVDIRRGSPTFGKWHGLHLSDQNKKQFWIPPGFAHGFCVLSETAMFHYKCTNLYSPRDEMTIRWDDPSLAINWPVANPIISEKDAKGLLLADVPPERLFA